jgi:hypothetical protein
MKPPGSTEWAPNTNTLPYRGTSAGGGYSTVGDLTRFAQALLGHELLSAESTSESGPVRVRRPRPHVLLGRERDRSSRSSALRSWSGRSPIQPIDARNATTPSRSIVCGFASSACCSSPNEERANARRPFARSVARRVEVELRAMTTAELTRGAVRTVEDDFILAVVVEINKMCLPPVRVCSRHKLSRAWLGTTSRSRSCGNDPCPPTRVQNACEHRADAVSGDDIAEAIRYWAANAPRRT